MKFLILLAYYARPNAVRLALESIRDMTHKDWELLVVDDGGEDVGPIVSEILAGLPNTITVVRTGSTFEDKQARKGSLHGRYFNEYVLASDAEVAMYLCDDDAFTPDGVEKLMAWFAEHPTNMYCWNYIVPYDPRLRRLPPPVPNMEFDLNKHAGALKNCSCAVDSSQVAYRTLAFKELGCRYPFPQTANLDAAIFETFAQKLGSAEKTGFAVQYKGIWPQQMGKRDSWHGDPGDA